MFIAVLLVGLVALGGSSVVASNSQSRTLVVLDEDVPPGLDPDGPSNGSQETVQTIVNFAAPLIEYPMKKVGDVLIPNYQVSPLNYHPVLATSYSKKGLVWTFKLLKGVKSCAGNEMTADDVVYTFQRAISVGPAPAGAFLGFVSGLWTEKPILSTAKPSDRVLRGQVKKIDRYTVQFTQMAVNDLFPRVLTLFPNRPWDSKFLKSKATKADPWAHTWTQTQAIPGFGYGPYCLTKWIKGNEIELTANPGYFKKPYYDKIIVRKVASPSNRVSALLTGNADVAMNLSPQQYGSLSKNSNVKVLSWSNDIPLYLAPNYSTPPWDGIAKSRLLRQAIAYALPYDKIINGVYLGKAQRWYHNCGPNAAYGAIQVKKYQTNIAKAKQLLAQAGYPNGKGLPTQGLTLYYNSDRSAWLEPVANYVRTALAQIGINIKLASIKGAELMTHVIVRRDLPLVMDDIDRPLAPDTGYCALLWYVSKDAGGRLYNVNYTNPAYDKLYKISARTTGAPRLAVLRKMQLMAMNDLPKIPIAQIDSLVAVGKDVTGWEGDSQDMMHFWAFSATK